MQKNRGPGLGTQPLRELASSIAKYEHKDVLAAKKSLSGHSNSSSITQPFSPTPDLQGDRGFLESMMQRHHAIIDVAQNESSFGASEAAKRLARGIVAARQAELAEMDGLSKTISQ